MSPKAPQTPKEKLLELMSPDFGVYQGSPLPFGATPARSGINFSVYSKLATSVKLVLFYPGDSEILLELPLDPHRNRTGNVWHLFLRGIDPRVEYGFRLDCKPNLRPHIQRFVPDQIMLDPYAKAVTGGEVWRGDEKRLTKIWPSMRPRRNLVVDDLFEWELDQPLNIPLSRSVLYELHVRGFTAHSSSGVSRPGTYLGLTEKIPYLRELGVTAVELLPVAEFEEVEEPRFNAQTGERLVNFWGYQPMSFFAPKASYASDPYFGAQVREFKEMVKRFHGAGIEVILDVVFNHSAEGNERGPAFSFRGIDNETFYMLDPETGRYHDYSGCGNTLNCNHPVVRNMIIDCLHYWVTEMHVDGFRFDLASILGRGQNGEVLANPPLLEHIAGDPVLANTKIIAEAWDAAGLYQVGSFPAWGRWAEWNGKYRDEVRRFVKGDAGMVTALARRLIGSPDLYRSSNRHPFHSINFVTCHDGFTLNDLVSYNDKHNEANGERNRDGCKDNNSWNCGVEGETNDPNVLALRQRQIKNFAALLLLSHGVPMLLAGDEFGRTQRGNNNAYCQDNELGWVDWRLRKKNAELFRFFQRLIAFRKQCKVLRPERFADDPSQEEVRVHWHGVRLHEPDWSYHSHTLAAHFFGPSERRDAEHVYVIANAHWEAHDFELPVLGRKNWHRFVDTSLASPDDVARLGFEAELTNQVSYPVGPRSVVVLVGK
jgi:isoamylase